MPCRARCRSVSSRGRIFIRRLAIGRGEYRRRVRRSSAFDRPGPFVAVSAACEVPEAVIARLRVTVRRG